MKLVDSGQILFITSTFDVFLHEYPVYHIACYILYSQVVLQWSSAM